MRYMGIDFGTKRVGIAISDESNTFALPHAVLANSKKLLGEVETLVREKGVTHIVLGESKDYKGKDNAVMEHIRNFKNNLEEKLKLPVIFETEILTSREAEHIQGKNEMHDASAAALILKSYLDRIK